MSTIFSVILNLEDTASSAYAVVADSIADGVNVLENVQEYDILSVDPLVRCRECKWHKTEDGWGDTLKFCTYIGGTAFVRKDDDFCSRGEREEDAVD